jgi:site-specific DNA-cytosine methylase
VLGVTGVSWSPTHAFSCEIDPKKFRFIKENFPDVPVVFQDIREMGQPSASAHACDTPQLVPRCDLLIAGVVCKGFSTLNKARATLVARLLAGDFEGAGPSGVSLKGLLDYVAVHLPGVVIVENVEAMLTPDKVANRSPADVLEDALVELGYSMCHMVVSTDRYGLPQVRPRVYFVGMLKLTMNAPAIEATTRLIRIYARTYARVTYADTPRRGNPCHRPTREALATTPPTRTHIPPHHPGTEYVWQYVCTFT